jgi:hypothetical protein
MSGIWHFNETKHGIALQARFEGAGGLIGDVVEFVRPGERFYGLSYRSLKRAKAGELRVVDGKAAVASTS